MSVGKPVKRNSPLLLHATQGPPLSLASGLLTHCAFALLHRSHEDAGGPLLTLATRSELRELLGELTEPE